MIKNVGQKDRIARLVLGLVLIAAALLLPVGMIMSLALIALGVLVIVSAAFSYCYLYKACDIDTGSPKTGDDVPGGPV